MTSLEGPDLNVSRSPLDKKVYRQILLPNGLRAVLISDTLAMHQDLFYDSDSGGDDGDGDGDGDDADDMDQDKDPDEDRNKDEHEDDDSHDSMQDPSESGNDGLRDAAAAMVVGVGSMYDPPEAQGLAHFLEHMLFMGTLKYPEENAYSAFLAKHGGSDNAYTEIEYTVYHLEIPQEKLFPALDMFAQFFVHPLMKEDAVHRELKSIESEFQLSKSNDQCRLQQLICHTSGTQPFCKFSWGNLQSLQETPDKHGVNVMDLLRKFYHQYYFAANMRLVVIGAYSLDELQKHVERSFADIPPDPRETPAFNIHYQNAGTWDATFQTVMSQNPLPMPKSALQKIYRLVPVLDRHTLSITWQVPPQIGHWRSKPCDYLAHLLGHEAQGSILASLKKKSWVTSCYAGVGSDGVEFASSHALFVVTLSLSEEGMNHWQDVCREVFAYIGMLRHLCNSNQLPDWIYQELKLMHDVSYQFSDEEDPQEFVERIADRFAPHFNTPPDRLLDSRDLFFEYDEDAIKDLLDNYMTPMNTRIDLMSSNFGREADFGSSGQEAQGEETASTEKSIHDIFQTSSAGAPMVEPMFGTHYWCEDIHESTIEQWTKAAEPQILPEDSMLALPPKNPFVPEKLDLKPLPEDDSDHPLLNSSLKLCISVGKRKAWFPATAVKYNGLENKMLLSYEDEDEKWHMIDHEISDLSLTDLVPGFEGSFDKKSIKFRLVALAKDGARAVLKYGDDSDFEVQDGSLFPAIPPTLSESRLPKLVCDRPELKLWHLQDRKFKRPIAELRLRLVCEGANKTPLQQACADLLVSLCADAVTDVSYLASVCDLSSTVSNSDLGFSLRVHGFDDKLLALFLEIFSVLLSFRGRSEIEGLPATVLPGRFEACFEVLMRKYENSGLKASQLASQIRIQCLRPTSWSSYEKSTAIQSITAPVFTSIITEVLTSVTIEAFYHGNVDGSDAIAAQNAILECLQKSGRGILSKKKYPTELVTQFPRQIEPLYVICPSKNVAESNTAVEVYFQVGKDNIMDRVTLDLLSHMMQEPLYDQLRTKDQFGYSLSCDSRWTCGIMGIHFVVVSSTRSADEITKRIDSFLLDYRITLNDMTPEQFMEHLVGLAKNKLAMFNSLSEETGCYWSEIQDNRLDFEVYRNEALALRSLTKEYVLAAFDEWLLPLKGGKRCERRALVVQVIGSGDEASAKGRPSVEIESVPSYVEGQVCAVHKSVGGITWGKVY